MSSKFYKLPSGKHISVSEHDEELIEKIRNNFDSTDIIFLFGVSVDDIESMASVRRKTMIGYVKSIVSDAIKGKLVYKESDDVVYDASVTIYFDNGLELSLNDIFTRVKNAKTPFGDIVELHAFLISEKFPLKIKEH